MALQFESLEELNDYIDFLQAKAKPIPNSLLEEKERMEREQNINPDEFIFGTMAANNPFMTQEKEKVVREMTDQLMSTDENATQPCLLLGKVQCGKTDTFLSIMGLCFDRGIDIAVVMTKGTNTLTKQTIQRLNKDFRFFADKQDYSQKVIVSIWDILDLGHRGGLSEAQLNNPAYKFILVVKKEDTNLRYLNELFENSELMRSKKVLVCDDEADFASRAYYQRKGEITLLRIAEHIENFIKLPAFCRYLQITATPYSLYLQPDGSVQLREGTEASPWLPRYTGLVPIHSKYVGGRQYYELSEDPNSMYSCLFQPVDDICIDILSARNPWYLESKAHSENLNSLNYAVVSYLFASAVRSIQVKKKSNKKYSSSCLIHCEISKKNHEWQEEIITEIIEDIKMAFIDKGNTDLHILDLESSAYESLRESNELGKKYELINETFPTFGEVEAEVKRILEFNDYTINVVNSENPVSTMLNEKGQLRLEQALNFFIGGNILDRGITIDNMLCFFYGRDPKKFQMDTVLQHARMYGARDKEDMACTRFFTTESIYSVLKTINNIDSMMYDYLKAHRDSVQTDEFTSMVIGYDKRIAASAANKYTPANTKVIKPKQRILPVGFQTGENVEIADTYNKITELIKACPDFVNRSDDNPYFLMPAETAVEIINFISSTFRYGEEYENVDYEWDPNEMLTALEHCTFDSDGMIYCLLREGRDMSRERSVEKRIGKTRWIDAPDDGNHDTAPSREKAVDRPVLMLLQQQGRAEKGWRDAPFYWPVFVVHQNAVAGIFTINGNKKFRAPRKQLQLNTLGKYPTEEVLKLTICTRNLFDILAGYKLDETRWIKTNNSSLYLEKDLMGKFILVEGTDPDGFYDLSTYNNGVFPFEVRKYKYLHLRNSQDMSGSQCIVKLDDDKPYELISDRFSQKDVMYDRHNTGADVVDNTLCDWYICFNIDKVLERVLNPQDEESFNQYVVDPNTEF